MSDTVMLTPGMVKLLDWLRSLECSFELTHEMKLYSQDATPDLVSLQMQVCIFDPNHKLLANLYIHQLGQWSLYMEEMLREVPHG